MILAHPAAVRVGQGAEQRARIELEVADGFHVQANPAAQPNLVPVRLVISVVPGLTVGSPRYPPGVRFRLQGADSDLAVYAGRFEVELPVQAGEEVAAGTYLLHGTVQYQACDDRHCLFPRTTPVILEATVVASGR